MRILWLAFPTRLGDTRTTLGKVEAKSKLVRNGLSCGRVPLLPKVLPSPEQDRISGSFIAKTTREGTTGDHEAVRNGAITWCI